MAVIIFIIIDIKKVWLIQNVDSFLTYFNNFRFFFVEEYHGLYFVTDMTKEYLKAVLIRIRKWSKDPNP